MNTKHNYRVRAPEHDAGSNAKTAFVLGWMCLPFGPLGIIPIVTGLNATRSLRGHQDAEARSLARWAVVLGAVALLGTALWLFLYTAIVHDSQKRGAMARMNAHAVGLVVYAKHNQETYPAEPDWYQQLIVNSFVGPTLLERSDRDHDGVVYTYIAGRTYEDSTQIMLYEDRDHWDDGVVVGFADGHVEMLPHDEFNRLLAEQALESP